MNIITLSSLQFTSLSESLSANKTLSTIGPKLDVTTRAASVSIYDIYGLEEGFSQNLSSADKVTLSAIGRTLSEAQSLAESQREVWADPSKIFEHKVDFNEVFKEVQSEDGGLVFRKFNSSYLSQIQNVPDALMLYEQINKPDSNGIVVTSANDLDEIVLQLRRIAAGDRFNALLRVEGQSSTSTSSTSVEIKLSPAESSIVFDKNIQPRFASDEEASANITKRMSELITQTEYATGKRRPFASAEDERLSHLSTKELMAEANNLPRVDEHGHLLSSVQGTERGDRINVAVGNILFINYFDRQKSAASVEASLDSFKKHIEEKYKIDANSYDVIFKDGKPTVVAKISSESTAANSVELEKIQSALDDTKGSASARNLQKDIKEYNKLSFEFIDNELTQHIYGAEKNPYIEKNISSDWLLDGTNYSTVTKGDGLGQKYLEIMANAREKYHAALKDGTHLSNYDIDPGLLELTRLRESINTKV